jgi:16S rRNA (cytosine1402-N4)-methyltransferase
MTQPKYFLLTSLPEVLMEFVSYTLRILITNRVVDAGVSSRQLDAAHRGFSYKDDKRGPLDMRMDQTSTNEQYTTAADIVNKASFKELYQILRLYGDPKTAHDTAATIAKYVALVKLLTVLDIVKLNK